MVEQYRAMKGYSPAVETKIPETTEELIGVLQSYKINDTNEAKYSLSMDSVGSPIPVSNFIITNEGVKEGEPEKKKSFFDKVRSVFKK